MVRKKLDNRIRVLIENNIHLKQRSFFVIVGDGGKLQIPVIHHIMSNARKTTRPNLLWCYKSKLGFISDRTKRMREAKRQLDAGILESLEDDPINLFVSSVDVRYCFYHETDRILGNTYGMLILQDFEAITPNLLARTIETVEGGGSIVLLLNKMDSLKQLFTMTMDVHERYRSEQCQEDIVARFNERFILSLASCSTCIVLDDQLNILPISSAIANIKPIYVERTDVDEPTGKEAELVGLKESLEDTHPVGDLAKLCKTLDQAYALLKFIDAISDKSLKVTVSLTAARGRGKSAALGLSVAAALAFGYSNIFITSPSPENLKTLFEFIFKGLEALHYEEHHDYDVVQSTKEQYNKAVIRVNVFKDHRQTIQYIHPTDASKLSQAELLVIDEAAAIPLPLVKALLGPYLVFMASTINGYEGTGRSLSLKLLQQLRAQSVTYNGATTKQHIAGRSLQEITLNEAIRYAEGDPVEAWLNQLLCLDASVVRHLPTGCPTPDTCELYYVNRDTLFSFHKAAEEFLQRIMSLYVSSHYKNSPNDLQMLSDSPTHHIFVLLPPVSPDSTTLPEVLVVLQVSLEGQISKESLMNSLRRGKRASGDLIPWTLTQQFQDDRFGQLSGARVVRIATHPDYQGMGYGRQAIQILQNYYEGKVVNLDNSELQSAKKMAAAADGESKSSDTEEGNKLLTEQLAPKKELPPLLCKLSERKAESLDYIGVAYGLTGDLLRFWRKNGFYPVYLRQTENTLTGENSCIMLKALNDDEQSASDWLDSYNYDFRRRLMMLLSFTFRTYNTDVALSLLQKYESPSGVSKVSSDDTLTSKEIYFYFLKYDLKRLEMYSNKLTDNHLIMDLVPHVARLFFSYKFPSIKLTAVQKAILLALGLQHRTIEDVEKELSLPVSQLLGLFNKVLRKVCKAINDLLTDELSTEMLPESQTAVNAVTNAEKDAEADAVTDSDKLAKDDLAEQFTKRVTSEAMLEETDIDRYKIQGDDDDWNEAVKSGESLGIVSIHRANDTRQKRKPVVFPEKNPRLKTKKYKKGPVKCPKN